MNNLNTRKVLIIGGIFVIILGFFIFDNPSFFEPSFYRAKRICYQEIKTGMTYEQVEEKFGFLFADVGMDGYGQVQLKNNIKLTSGSCRVLFKNNIVISHEMLFEGI